MRLPPTSQKFKLLKHICHVCDISPFRMFIFCGLWKWGRLSIKYKAWKLNFERDNKVAKVHLSLLLQKANFNCVNTILFIFLRKWNVCQENWCHSVRHAPKLISYLHYLTIRSLLGYVQRHVSCRSLLYIKPLQSY